MTDRVFVTKANTPREMLKELIADMRQRAVHYELKSADELRSKMERHIAEQQATALRVLAGEWEVMQLVSAPIKVNADPNVYIDVTDEDGMPWQVVVRGGVGVSITRICQHTRSALYIYKADRLAPNSKCSSLIARAETIAKSYAQK